MQIFGGLYSPCRDCCWAFLRCGVGTALYIANEWSGRILSAPTVDRIQKCPRRGGNLPPAMSTGLFLPNLSSPNLEQLVVGSSPIQKNKKNGAHKAVYHFGWTSRLRNLLRNSPPDCFCQICKQIWSSLSLVRVNKIAKEKPIRISVSAFFGSPSWTRTNDPAVNSRMLYQLSY